MPLISCLWIKALYRRSKYFTSSLQSVSDAESLGLATVFLSCRDFVDSRKIFASCFVPIHSTFVDGISPNIMSGSFPSEQVASFHVLVSVMSLLSHCYVPIPRDLTRNIPSAITHFATGGDQPICHSGAFLRGQPRHDEWKTFWVSLEFTYKRADNPSCK